ncbi:MAG: T9SS type A sorting domain-containing protein [Chitinophagaceae bacterium]|nr:T9SS type A sorting domain-containing protein [Chitinophagaceae bacterium]
MRLSQWPGKNKNLKQPLIRAIKLYDLVGNVKLYQKTKGVKQATLNISGLLPGTYFIEISDKDYKEKQQVIIQ